MLPGKGSVVANASGTGVHEMKPYCGHGGGGGLTNCAAFCCCVETLTLGITMRLADAAAAKSHSEPATASATERGKKRRGLSKDASEGRDGASVAGRRGTQRLASGGTFAAQNDVSAVSPAPSTTVTVPPVASAF